MPFVTPESENCKSMDEKIVCEKCLGDELIGDCDLYGPKIYVCLCTKVPGKLACERIELFKSSGIPLHHAQDRLTNAPWGTIQIFLDQLKNGTLDNMAPIIPEPIKIIEECNPCENLGYKVKEGKRGFVVAEPCKACHSDRRSLIDSITNARIPNLYIEAVTDNGENLSEPFVFLTGNVGTGKTRRAIQLLVQAIKRGDIESAIYLPLYDYTKWAKKAATIDFKGDRHENTETKNVLKNYEAALQYDFVVIDEVGQKVLTPSEEAMVFDHIDKRYAQKKHTVLVSNHCNDKKRTLDGKTLESLVGKRISSRLESGKVVYFDGTDRRKKNSEVEVVEAVAVEAEVVTKEEAENFNMGEASPKLMTLDDNTHHIMTWLTRNPAFETVDTKKRNSLTEIVKGTEWDKDRQDAAVYDNVWGQGNSLIVTGPLCDQEDMKLYALLVRRLVEQHKLGSIGLDLKISLKEIIRLLEQKESGINVARVKRQLNRLTRMALSFKSSKGRSWMGPLLTEVASVDEGRNSRLKISFSHFMISFYKAHEYTLLNREGFWSLSGDSATLFAFYTSQEFKKQSLSYNQIQRLLAIPETVTKKAITRRIKTAYQKLIDLGLFDASNTKIENEIIHTVRAS